MSTNELTAHLKLDIGDWGKKLGIAKSEITLFMAELAAIDPMDISTLMDTSQMMTKFDEQVKEMKLSFKGAKPILAELDEIKDEKIPTKLQEAFGKQIVDVNELILDFKGASISDINKPVTEMQEAVKEVSSLIDTLNAKLASIPEDVKGIPAQAEATAREITTSQITQGMDTGELNTRLGDLINSIDSLKGATMMLERELLI